MDAIVAAMSSLAGIDLAALGAACEKYFPHCPPEAAHTRRSTLTAS